jgi:hypothetical protein
MDDLIRAMDDVAVEDVSDAIENILNRRLSASLNDNMIMETSIQTVSCRIDHATGQACVEPWESNRDN